MTIITVVWLLILAAVGGAFLLGFLAGRESRRGDDLIPRDAHDPRWAG